MVTTKSSHFSCAANFFRGRKRIFCGSFKVCRTARRYLKCQRCRRQKSLAQLRREMEIIKGFYQQVPAYRLATDLAVAQKTVARVYQPLRECLYHTAALEAGRLRGESELDEAYFGGRRKGKRGRGAVGKSLVFGLLEGKGHVYTKVIEGVSAAELPPHIRAKTRKGSVYYTDSFSGYRSLKRYGKHHQLNHSKSYVARRTKNHINGIEGFWSYAKHLLYNYRGVSKYHFPVYVKEMEYRFNHRGEHLYKQFI